MTLKRVYNNIIPFKGYKAITFYPWVFIRESARQRYTDTVDRHETTHAHQQLECLWLFFFLIYGLEYLIKLLCTFSTNRAYESVSFEQEAYEHEDEIGYNNVRKHFAWVKYVFKLKE